MELLITSLLVVLYCAADFYLMEKKHDSKKED